MCFHADKRVTFLECMSLYEALSGCFSGVQAEGGGVGLTLGWKAPCSELKGPECGSSGGMPGMVGG